MSHMAMISTFETLPDEILMIIFRYSGDVYSVFHAYAGLNQRINSILVDRRVHLLSNFLNIKDYEITFNDYFNSPSFKTILQELYSLRKDSTENRLHKCLQNLVAFHIHEKYRQYEQELLFNRQKFETIRSNLTNSEIILRDMILKKTFRDLKSTSEASEWLHQLETLSLHTGARLECTDHELGDVNLTQIVNQYLLAYTYSVQGKNRSFLDLFIKVVKGLIISNPSLINNKDYVGNGGAPMYFFLSYAIYRLQDFYTASCSKPITTQNFQVILDFFLFVIQCLSHMFDNTTWVIDCILHSLQFVRSIENDVSQQIIIQTSQMELLKILLNEMIKKNIVVDYFSDYSLLQGFRNVIRNRRIDMIMFIFQHEVFMETFLDRSNNRLALINKMTGSHSTRRLFKQILDKKPLASWLTSTELFFILLSKKECRLIKKLVHQEPALIHRLDTDGNNALLYLALKVNGCRHRLIEFFIACGCDIKRRNNHDEHFIQVLQQKRNKTLLAKLIDHQILTIENETEQLSNIFINI